MDSNLQWYELVEDLDPETTGETALLKLKQDLTYANLKAFQAFAGARLREGKHTLKLEFSSVKFIDSAGVGAMAALHKSCKEKGGELVLLNPNATVRSILKIVGLDRLLRLEVEELPALTGRAVLTQKGKPNLALQTPPPSRAGLPPPSRASLPPPSRVDVAPPSRAGVANVPSRAGTPPVPSRASMDPAPVVAAPVRPSSASDGVPDQDVDDAVSRLLLREMTVQGPGSGTHVAQSSFTIQLKENLTYRNASTVADGFMSYLRKGVTTLRAEMSRVDFVDSAGLAALMKVARSFSESGGSLVLIAPSENLMRILKITKFDRVIKIEAGDAR